MNMSHCRQTAHGYVLIKYVSSLNTFCVVMTGICLPKLVA